MNSAQQESEKPYLGVALNTPESTAIILIFTQAGGLTYPGDRLALEAAFSVFGKAPSLLLQIDNTESHTP